MNKTELIEIIATENEITKEMASKCVNTFIKTVIDSVSTDEPVVLVGFGTFRSVERKGRMIRNPRTGEEMKLTDRKAPKFLPSNAFKNAVDPSCAKPVIKAQKTRR